MRLRRMNLRAGPATPEHVPTTSGMSSFSLCAERASRHVLAGEFEEQAVADALARASWRGAPTKILRRLARKLVARFGRGRRPRLREVCRFLLAQSAFHRAFRGVASDFPEEPPVMRPAAGAPQGWNLPPLPTVADLAGWLQLSLAEVSSLAARWRGDDAACPRSRHYHYRWIPRRGRLPRLVEAPKPRLKWVQRRILIGILDHIPAHAAAHGFRTGRSIVTFTAPHAGRPCVLRMDVHDFFPSLRRARVLRVFLTAGYPESVAGLLADLCTTITPAAVRISMPGATPELAWPIRQKLRARHLPQGAPTSPALANLCAFGLDARLSGLARRFGAEYTRYADDLLFSGGGDFARSARRCEVQARAILLEGGLAAAHRKTKIMRASSSQRAAGLVLNVRPGLPRRERDQLKAILTNCLRHGPASQNRAAHPNFRAHLEGRISHALATHPDSATKLRKLFESIDWGR